MSHHVFTHEESIDPQLGYQPNVTEFIMNISKGLGTMVATLDSIKEGDGTLLDRMLLMATTDTGYAKVHAQEQAELVRTTLGAAALDSLRQHPDEDPGEAADIASAS